MAFANYFPLLVIISGATISYRPRIRVVNVVFAIGISLREPEIFLVKNDKII